jgi:hypothetical protein
VVGFIWSFREKLSPTKILLLRYYQNKTSFSWSYRDSQKGHWKIMLFQGGGQRKIHTLEISGHVQMAKSDPEAQAKSSLSDHTWLERWLWVLILNPLETPNASRELGSFIYISFLSLIYIFLFFFPFLSYFLFPFIIIFLFFIPPWTLDYIVPTSLAAPHA